MHLSELKTLHISQLLQMATELEIDNAQRMRKQELMFAILKKRAKQGEQIFGDGTLEVLPDGFGFLRSPDTSYLASTDDIYISPSQIRRNRRADILLLIPALLQRVHVQDRHYSFLISRTCCSQSIL